MRRKKFESKWRSIKQTKRPSWLRRKRGTVSQQKNAFKKRKTLELLKRYTSRKFLRLLRIESRLRHLPRR